MFIAVLLTHAMLLTGCTGRGGFLHLLKRKCLIFLRLIFNSCIRQKACVACGVFRSVFLI